MSIFTGSGVAIVTPFDENLKPDYPKLKKLIDWQIDNGSDCIVICGTTGEASTLTDEEQLDVIKAAVEMTGGRVPVVAGTGSNDTHHGIELSKAASALGVDGLLLVTPYYNKTSQKGLIEHFSAIANAVDVPIILYNVPSRTGMNILPETVAELSKLDNIVGIKEASSNIVQIAKVAQLCQGRIDLYSGNDDQVTPIMSLGGVGVISAAANIIPQELHDVASKYLEGDIKGSLEVQLKIMDIVAAVFCEVNPIPVKAALALMGQDFDSGICRPPLTTMEPQNFDKLKKAMTDYGFSL